MIIIIIIIDKYKCTESHGLNRNKSWVLGCAPKIGRPVINAPIGLSDHKVVVCTP